MLSIVLIIIIWNCNFMPLWANIVCTTLLAVRCAFRAMMTWVKLTRDLQTKIYENDEGLY